MNKLYSILLLAILLVATGCGKMERKYTPPMEYSPVISREYKCSFDKVWRATIDSLSESFWTLDNIEKDSGILTLSCTFPDPTDWIDCGRTRHQAKMPTWNINQDITYDNASKIQALIVVKEDGTAFDKMLRTVKVSARCNVIVKQKGHDSTTVTINTKYAVIVDYKFKYGLHFYPSTHDVGFSNRDIGIFEDGEAAICRSKNTFEAELLNAIGSKL